MKARIEDIDNVHEAHVCEARVDDLKEVADYAQARANAGLQGSKDMWFAATVPAFIIQKFCNEKGVAWKEFMRNESMQTYFLNSEYAAPFRVHKGTI
jgi:hypothetical protein